jgi:poly-gamma-glutamate capsule biosynthesis protein CapA/YwtB (metallophosphatase superfamily)
LYANGIAVTGQVMSEDGTPLAGATVEINGTAVKTSEEGVFQASVSAADVYTVRYGADGFFSVVHSYSPLELSWSGHGDTSTLPDVTLVERAEGRVMMAFGGDAMMGRRYSSPYPGEPGLIREGHKAEDAKALLRHVKPYLELADFASVNLETQVMHSRPEAKAPKSFVFFTPPEAVAAFRDAGVDYVTLGNNHTNDYLAEGLSATLESLAAADMPHSGAGLNESDALRAHRTAVGGNEYSFLGYVGWAGNFTPNQVADGPGKSGAALGSGENIERTVMREASAGYLPIIQYHGSREYTDEPTLVTETRLKQAIDEGAVLAIAHHPHVVQGFELYRDRLIAYSMGNFIFDQFHYATQYSYMVYVWMDGDRFHRAEVVPLHIQGYTPMPATDTVRQKVLKRTLELSKRRGIQLGRSGGNGVILPAGTAPGMDARTLTVSEIEAGRSGVTPLYRNPWNEPFTRIAAADRKAPFLRLGEDMLPTGHLENHHLHGSPDRSWISDGTQSVVTSEDGNRVMQLKIPAGTESGRVGMRTFEYTFEPGRPSSFTARVRVEAPATVTAYQQWRGRNDRSRVEALANNKLRAIGKAELQPGPWQDLRFDFDSPRVSAVSYRVVLVVEPGDGSREHITYFDDFNLVEWLTPHLAEGELPAFLAVEQASHVDLRVQ